MKRSYIREILDATNENTISFAGGLPNASLFPLKEIQEASTRALNDLSSLQYSKSCGIKSLRKKIAKMYTEKLDFKTSSDEILITTGSQQSFFIICKMFKKEEILIQNPSYIGAISAFNTLDLRINGFDNIKDLNKKLNTNNNLYLMSDFQNPNTSIYSDKERLEIINILESKKNYLIEDAAYSYLSFDGHILKPIASEYQNSFHLGSFSKILVPGLRVGWIRAKKELINKLLISKEAIDLHTATLNQMIIDEYLENNDLESHLKIIRNDYKNRMLFMSKCLKKYLKDFTFDLPKGGMFIYGQLKGINTMELAQKVLEKNVAFVPGEVFYFDNRKSNEIRFNFTNSSYKDMIKGIKILSSLI
ncbi:MAG: PLP-dependent aminotransferase family protein [Campylobacterales bacterium]|nr:PLP-dependent aminotransferase family protein [Campylobacterales bacterium]